MKQNKPLLEKKVIAPELKRGGADLAKALATL
jgi:hypothetical protein